MPRALLCCAAALAAALAACADGDRERAAAQARRGARLLAQYHCGSCHAVPGVPGADGRFAVTLQAFGVRSYISGRVPNDEATLTRFIVAPQAVVPGSPMPAMGVTPDEARAIAAYLRSLR
jgi:cytochrome c2